MIRMAIGLAVGVFTLWPSSFVIAATSAPVVYPGCASPPTRFNHVWYFDPVNGKTVAQYAAMNPPIPMPANGSGPTSKTQGSQQHPWNDLSALDWANSNAKAGYKYPLLTSVPYYQLNAARTAYAFSTGPLAGPIEPGDEILLNTGTYPALTFSLPYTQVVNSAFVTITAAPGQSPVLTSLVIGDINDLEFIGLKFQRLANPNGTQGAGTLVSIVNGYGFATHDIVFANDDLSNADASVVAGWSQAQFAANTNAAFQAVGSNLGAGTYCVSITGSHVHNVQQGITLNSQRSIAENNEIDHWSDNAFTHAGSYQIFQGNYLHDPVDVGLTYHVDGFQGEGFPHNIAPIVTWVSYQPNVTADHNIAQELVYWTENAQGVFSANPLWFRAPGFYGPAGLGAQSRRTRMRLCRRPRLTHFL